MLPPHLAPGGCSRSLASLPQGCSRAQPRAGFLCTSFSPVVFGDGVLLCSPGWPPIPGDILDSASRVLGLQVELPPSASPDAVLQPRLPISWVALAFLLSELTRAEADEAMLEPAVAEVLLGGSGFPDFECVKTPPCVRLVDFTSVTVRIA